MSDRIAIVVPAYNEEAVLERSIKKLSSFVARVGLTDCDIIIADNNSTDSTGALARGLVENGGGKVRYHFVEQRGKGAAIRNTWRAFDEYGVYCFTDVDLAGGLSSLPVLIAAVRDGCGVAIGSRYVRGARARRTWSRRTISVVYRLMFDLLFASRVLDPQCGLKAISRTVRDNVLPRVESNGFFFDTELILRTRAAGYAIKEVPIRWIEKPGSTVNLFRDVPGFLVGLARLKWEQWSGRLTPPAHLKSEI